ncbi:MAG: hypothetical protein DSY46_05325 [Hydrogenimonas sp.]|nr:MAG: hypothetical protein DSY46_05325 [Hydrogenimonas sp.]
MRKIFLFIWLLLGYATADQITNTIKIAKFFGTFLESTKSIPDSEIIKLSKLSDSFQGTKQVKKIIGKMNLPQEVQEDIYLRIAVYQGKISRAEAKQMFKNLSGKDGFKETLSKIIGNSDQVTKGHLNELRIANHAVEEGFDVIAIGKKFDDGVKNSLTDIDVLLKKDGKEILIEAKNYASSTKMPIDKYKADLDTLNLYAQNHTQNSTLKVFSFTEKPQNKEVLRQYKFWAKRKGVELIFGTPEQQVEQIKILLTLL